MTQCCQGDWQKHGGHLWGKDEVVKGYCWGMYVIGFGGLVWVGQFGNWGYCWVNLEIGNIGGVVFVYDQFNRWIKVDPIGFRTQL